MMSFPLKLLSLTDSSFQPLGDKGDWILDKNETYAQFKWNGTMGDWTGGAWCEKPAQPYDIKVKGRKYNNQIIYLYI